MWYKNIAGRISHKACVWQTDGWTELRLPRPC